jgi:integrase
VIPVQFTAGSGCDSPGLLTRKLFRARSLSVVSEAPTSEELGVERLCRGRFRYSSLKEAAPWDYGILHAFRRGLASNLYEMGAPDKVVQRVLRHSKPHVTKERDIKAV